MTRKLFHGLFLSISIIARAKSLMSFGSTSRAALPTVSDATPLYEQVNLQVGVEAWLAAAPGRTHEVIGITGVPQMRFNDISIGDLIVNDDEDERLAHTRPS